MGVVAPNLAALIGDTVGARLISKAGSLTSLAKCPASTVQILGAEKVRALALTLPVSKYRRVQRNSCRVYPIGRWDYTRARVQYFDETYQFPEFAVFSSYWLRASFFQVEL